MASSLVLTVIGDDRPGIVEQLAEKILAAGGNWEESQLARLAGKFAGVVRVTVASDGSDALAQSLKTLAAGGLTVVVERAHEAAPAVPLRSLRLDLVGDDHPGIIRDISRAFARQHANIEALETLITSAPMTGDTLFHARAHVRVPASVTREALRQELEALADELMVELALDEQDENG
jgi:glycine cleavage system regulatory protein